MFAFLASPLLAEGLLRLASGYSPEKTREEIDGLYERVRNRPERKDKRKRELRGSQVGREPHPFYGSASVGDVDRLDAAIAEHRGPERAQRYMVWLCGGSVAEMFSNDANGGLEHLRELLERLPALRGKELTFLRLARVGYKQPQHLGKLTYLLSRGAVPDLVINLDGLNELRGGMMNFKAGQRLSFPTAAHWAHLISDIGNSPDTLALLVRLQEARAAFLAEAEAALASRALSSALLGGMRRRGVQNLFARYTELEKAYTESLPRPVPPTESTPERRAAAVASCLDNWSESSMLMDALCKSKGALYLHVLQPTLHDPGAKVITERERELGIGEEGLDPRIAGYYTTLRERGKQLSAGGVLFLDASRIFEGNAQTLYHDRAHFGAEGNRLLAEAMAACLQAHLQDS